MPHSPPDAEIADQAPTADAITGYDRAHLATYIRLLDAEADGAGSTGWSAVCVRATSPTTFRPATDALSIFEDVDYCT